MQKSLSQNNTFHHSKFQPDSIDKPQSSLSPIEPDPERRIDHIESSTISTHYGIAPIALPRNKIPNRSSNVPTQSLDESFCSEDIEPYYEEVKSLNFSKCTILEKVIQYLQLPDKPYLNTDMETILTKDASLKRRPVSVLFPADSMDPILKYNSTSSTEVDSARGTGSPNQNYSGQ